MRLQNAYHIILDRMEWAIEHNSKTFLREYQSELAGVEHLMDINDEAARKSGYEQGLGLAARRMMVMEDYSLARIVQRARIANKGKPLSAASMKKFEGFAAQLKERKRQSSNIRKVHPDGHLMKLSRG